MDHRHTDPFAVRIGDHANAIHTYSVGVEKDGVIGTIRVDANNRTQAAKVARDNGYSVRDMSMEG